jgi:hypothetical protein
MNLTWLSPTKFGLKKQEQNTMVTSSAIKIWKKTTEKHSDCLALCTTIMISHDTLKSAPALRSMLAAVGCHSM